MIRTWDHEIKLLEQDVLQLKKQASRLPDAKFVGQIEEERKRIETISAETAVLHDRSNLLLRKSKKVPGRAAAAIGHWSKQHLAKLKSLSDEFLALQTRKMWLRLLQVRFSDAQGQEHQTLEASQLVDLVQRRQKLTRIERDLELELKEVALRRAELKVRYDAIGTADQNWDAAGSMSARLGVDISDAAEHPSTIALSDLMKVASIPVRYPEHKNQLRQLNRDLTTRSDQLVSKCSHLAADFVKKGQNAIDGQTLSQFKNMIHEVEDLNESAGKMIHKLLKAKVETSRPKIVQKS